MSILLHKENRVLIQGITGKMGRFCTRDMGEYGTNIVAGVAPGRDGVVIEAAPVFGNVTAAIAETQANTSLIFVPASAALDATVEALEAGCRLVVYPGDGLPIADAIEMRAAAKANGAILVGPNSPGIISPGKAKLGFMPSASYRRGAFGVISRSGSLSYEVSKRLSTAGYGQSTVVGIGGDPIKGFTAREAVACFHGDPETHGIVYLGEIGGADEYDIADYATSRHAKPVVALVVGGAAPRGKKMGHAAALIGSARDTSEAKIAALKSAGVGAAAYLSDFLREVELVFGDPDAEAAGRPQENRSTAFQSAPG